MELSHVKALFGNRVLVPAVDAAAASAKVSGQKSPPGGAARQHVFVPPQRAAAAERSAAAVATRAIPTIPGFYQPAARLDGYRIVPVNPSFLRPETANVLRPDGSFRETSEGATATAASSSTGVAAGGASKSTQAATASAPAKATSAEQGAAHSSGAGAGIDLKDPSLYSRFDSKGFPTHDKNGEELTKNQYKKVSKLIEGERKKQAKKK